eukprot:Nitzschia sp. Nitz4//scaffold346_size17405//10631//14100//NITZ4_008831-RA/size17405-augustus-gene-0.10-mRNA-1//1//CDS//3329548653//2410//frame0
MIGILVAVAVGLCVATFLFVRREEEDDFRSLFETEAADIVLVSTENVEASFLAIETFAASIAAHAKGTGMMWPNVTVEDFASLSTLTMEAAGNGLLQFCPYVSFDDRLGFEEYVRQNMLKQLEESQDFLGTTANLTDVSDVIRYTSEDFQFVVEPYEGSDIQSEYLVVWQSSILIPMFILNNINRVPTTSSVAAQVKLTKSPKVSFFESAVNGTEAQVIQPIFQDNYSEDDADKREVVGVLWMLSDWDQFFSNILTRHQVGPRIVLESSCGFVVTYDITGPEAVSVGFGDYHDPKYDGMEISSDFFSFDDNSEDYDDTICLDHITLRIYPTDDLKDSVLTSKPYIYAGGVALIFLCTCLMFLVYDWTVRLRQNKVMDRIAAQDKIVSNLFPETIRDRLYGNDNEGGMRSSLDQSSHSASKDPSDFQNVSNPRVYGGKPIADLFLETTVLFADISGFTAWSSAREPSQVFILLENVYGAFDRISHRHNVFKIETVGDCYVAVTGLPVPNKKHCVAMAKFARDCVRKMAAITTKMEIVLGPDTGDLGIRIGIHSGQVTAGVLRGERSRFQLFGDTVNVAARMESSGQSGKIQMSEVSAELLKNSGYSKWVNPRGDVLVRGKGAMRTYWLETHEDSEKRHVISDSNDAATMNTSMVGVPLTKPVNSDEDAEDTERGSDEQDDEDYETSLKMSKTQRLVAWNSEILRSLLKRILAARIKQTGGSLRSCELSILQHEMTVLEEFEEIIKLPKLTLNDLKRRKDPKDIMLDDHVVEQLQHLISQISRLYRDNSFHSFEHASHVTASVAKLLSRIVTSDSTQQTSGPSDIDETDLARHSYGITSDPLTQFAVVFSAIIHDVDHQGVPNAELVRENDPLVDRYKGKSLAEQNSVDLAWEILMRPEYSDLRACIYADESELKRFRQLVVNMVMATDIADKELGALRKARWNKAFDPRPDQHDSGDLIMNRKATIVLEHLIQASDVSHTMQHWHVYIKWNQMFFNECYKAWKEGRAEKDPSLGWYEGEIGFFNFYIVPLAKKLDSCGVFGVSSHEYLNYAKANLEEWTRTGNTLVQNFVKDYNEGV